MPFTPEQLEEILNIEEEVPPTNRQKHAGVAGSTISYDDKMRRLGERWKYLLSTPGAHGYDSASECDNAIVWALAKRNYTDAEIIATLEASARYPARIDRKGEKHARELFELEIKKAREKVEPFPPDERTQRGELIVDVGANRNGHRTDEDAADEAEPPPAGQPDESAIPEHFTDLGNAEFLIERHGWDIRYSPGFGYLVWTGKRWQRDVEAVRVEYLAQQTVRALYKAAYDEPDPDRRGRIAKHAKDSESAKHLAAIVRLARSQPAIAVTIDQFDCDPLLLNVENGTLDLRTGALREHCRENLITKLAPVVYDAGATCPLFLTFLDTIFHGKQELIDFIQRAVGYALTGDVSERVLFVLYGKGKNGKSTLIGIIMFILGEYGRRAAPNVLMLKKHEEHPAEIAHLAGARFVAAIESEEGRRLAEASVKAMTGNDKMSARFMRENWFDFHPTHKVFLATNHKPMIRGTDAAIWDRIRLVPFDKRISDADDDKHFGDKLKAEAPGILAWGVRGAQAWLADGLGTPAAVRKATEDYQREMDVLADFIAERCVVSAEATAEIGVLYAAYTSWCDQTRERPLTKKTFGTQLEEHGFTPDRAGHGGGRVRRGIALVEKATADRGAFTFTAVSGDTQDGDG